MTTRIKDWQRFQHYQDGSRKPDWIKLYRDLLDDVDFDELDGAAAKVLVKIWLVASECGGALPPLRKLAFRLRLTETQTKSMLSKLSHWLEQDDSEPLADCYQSDTLEEEENKKKNKNASDSELKTNFDEFWKAYPRKIAKGAAKKAYRHALSRASPEEILAGVRRYVASKPEPKFTAHPASWLNADRWLDELKADTVVALTQAWKPFKPETEPEKPPADERQRQVERVLRKTVAGMHG